MKKNTTVGLSTLIAGSLALPALAQDLGPEYILDMARLPPVTSLTEFSKQPGLQIDSLSEASAANPLAALRPIAATIDEAPIHGDNMRLAAAAETANARRSTTAKTARREANIHTNRSSRDMEEVIVTAQKRKEQLQDVAISISVLSGDQLDRSTVTGVREALNSVPGVTITTNQTDSPLISVRGVSATGARFNGSSTTAYYVDAVPYGLVKTAIVPDAGSYDLERIEVLRGPQGTLYGASALNGVVRVLTNDANPDGFELKARSSVSSTEDGGEGYRGDMAINVPLMPDKLAVRAVVGYQDLGGWIDRPNMNVKDANDAQVSTFRFKVKGQATEQLSVSASAWLSRIDHGAPSTGDANARNSSRVDEMNSDDYDAYSVNVEYDLQSVVFTSTTSYLSARTESLSDFTPAGLAATVATDVDADVFTQEFLLSLFLSNAWKGSIGAMYRDAQDQTVQLFPSAPASPIFNMEDSSESIAAYAEVTRVLLDGKLELTGGLRYFEDRVEMRDRLPGSTTRARGEFDAVTPRIVLAAHPGEDWTIYASYSEGFRSGAQQNPAVVRRGLPATNPDTLKNYELGAKADLFGNAFSFDAAIYFIDWQDVQQSVAVPITTSAGTTFTAGLVNTGSASGIGVDLGLAVRPLDGLTLSGNISWNDLGLDQTILSGGVVLYPEGARLNQSMERTINAALDYVFPLAGGYKAGASVSAHYVSELYLRSATSVLVSDDMWTGRVGLSIHAPKHWSATLFVDNVNNQQGVVMPSLTGGADWATRPRPRTVGLQFEFDL